MTYVILTLIALAVGFLVGYIMGRTHGYSNALLRLDEVMFPDEQER